MKKISLLSALLCIASMALAQEKSSIKVIDHLTRHPLVGATVTINGISLVTDSNGFCMLPCPIKGSLKISYVGYLSYSALLRNCTSQQVALIADVAFLAFVEVTATSSKNKGLLYQPNSISKLSLNEIRRGQGIFFDDAIHTNIPGVQMNRRSVAGGQQFNIRGYGNGARGTRGVSSNFDGQGYKVYLNGIPLTDAEGITTMDDIDFGSIGNAEIVKGPAGALYGQAIAGAINLSTLTPEKDNTSIIQDVQAGNYGLRRYTTTFKMATERNSLLLNYGNQQSSGFAWHNRSKKDYVNISYTSKASEKQTLSLYAGFTDSYDERLGELTPSQWAARDYSGNIEYLKRNAHSHVTTIRAGVTHHYAFSKNLTQTTSIFGTGFRSDVSSAGGWTDKTSINYGVRSSLDVRLPISKDILITGISGLELQRQDAQVIGYNMKQHPLDTTTTSGWNFSKPYWVINATTSNTAFVTSQTLLFSQWSVHLPNELSVTAGISYNSQRIALDDRFNAATATRPARFDTLYANMASPYIAFNKVIKKRISVYTSYSTGYKAPVSSYFFITTPTVANPPLPATARVNAGLRPEKGSQWEIGSKGTLLNNSLQYQLALFHTRFTNKMTAVSVPLNNTATAYSYMVNGGMQLHRGIELSLKYGTSQSEQRNFVVLSPFINVAFSDFSYGKDFKFITGSTASTLDTFLYGGLSVFGTPRLAGALGMDATFKFGGYATISSVYKGGFIYALEKISNNPKRFVPREAAAYNLINFKMGYRCTIQKKWSFDAYAGVNNLTGEQYPLMVFVNQLPDAFTPAPPRAVLFGGFQLTYRIQPRRNN